MSLRELSVRSIRDDGAAVVAAAAHDPAAAIPSCPGWTMFDLVRHVGRLHRWVGLIVRERKQEPVSVRDLPSGPDEPAAQREWFEEGCAALADALSGLGEDDAVWNWRFGVGPARFWLRRVAAETALHRWDAQNAVGAEQPVGTELAVAAVDEMGDLWLPLLRDRVVEVSTAASMHLHCTDAKGEWLVRFGPDGATTSHEHAKGDLAVRGTASNLYLLLWNRVGAERFEVFGDAALLARFAELVRI